MTRTWFSLDNHESEVGSLPFACLQRMISLADFWSGGVWRNNAWGLSAVSERSWRRGEIPALNRHAVDPGRRNRVFSFHHCSKMELRCFDRFLFRVALHEMHEIFPVSVSVDWFMFTSVNPLPTEPLPTWDTEVFFGIFEGFWRNITTIFWVVLCPKHLGYWGQLSDLSKKKCLHDLVT
jgi:hypothetical protein